MIPDWPEDNPFNSAGADLGYPSRRAHIAEGQREHLKDFFRLASEANKRVKARDNRHMHSSPISCSSVAKPNERCSGQTNTTAHELRAARIKSAIGAENVFLCRDLGSMSQVEDQAFLTTTDDNAALMPH